MVIDQFSRGSYWMVTDCAEEWEENEIAEMCHNVSARWILPNFNNVF